MSDIQNETLENANIGQNLYQDSPNQETLIEESSIELKLPVQTQRKKQTLIIAPLKDFSPRHLLSPTCSKHSNEQLQFYCYNKNVALCAECLVTGKYAGLEIANFKKAIERFESKFKSQLNETEKKLESWNLVEKEIFDHEKEFEMIISTYEETVKEQMNLIRQKIDEKEHELLENLDKVKKNTQDEIQSILNWLQSYKNEMSEIKTINDEDLKNLDELNFCNFYLRQSTLLQTYLDYEVTFKAQEVNLIIHQFQSQGKDNLNVLQAECKKLQEQIETLRGFQNINIKLDPISTIKLTPPNSSQQNLKGIQSVSSFENVGSNEQEQTVGILLHNMNTNASSIQIKPSYLPNGVYGESHLNDLTTNKSTAELFEKHIEKLLEIRRKTPSKERKISERAFSKEERRTDSLSSKIEVTRGNTNKVANNNLLKDYSQDFFIKNPTANSKGILKSFILSTSPKSSKVFSSGLSSANVLQEISGMTKISSILDKQNKNISEPNSQISTTRTIIDNHTDKPYHYSSKNLKRGNEILSVLGGSRGFEKNRAQEKKELIDTNMKKTLDKLNNGLFN